MECNWVLPFFPVDPSVSSCWLWADEAHQTWGWCSRSTAEAYPRNQPGQRPLDEGAHWGSARRWRPQKGFKFKLNYKCTPEVHITEYTPSKLVKTTVFLWWWDDRFNRETDSMVYIGTSLPSAGVMRYCACLLFILPVWEKIKTTKSATVKVICLISWLLL